MFNSIRYLTIVMSVVANASAALSQSAAKSGTPTIVLVHGAFADSSSWNGVIAGLHKHGYRVVAASNELRGVASDAAEVATVLKAVNGPVVLVGHSYGGPVITAAANGNANVMALVYVAAFLPDAGESALELTAKFPGATLGAALAPAVSLPNGGQDLYIDKTKFPAQFAADVPLSQARLMAATQRPVAQAALSEKSGTASWKTIPSYSIYGSKDLNIPPAAMKFMAERANSKRTIVVEGASHVVMISHPDKVVALIEEASLLK